MTYLIAIILMAFSVVFAAWHLSHGIWTWEFFMVCSLFCALLSRHEKWPY